jgi:tRNA threonylcarbamoyladenosine biosynthesis protein TsaB
MYLLSIDTTTPWGSVALLRDEELVGDVQLHEETHSRTLFPAIEALLQRAGVKASAIDAYAVATGPGSFTGVRVGLGAVQGLALASGRPCLGQPTLLGLAAKMKGHAAQLVPMIDAYREQVYGAVYDGELKPVKEPVAATPEELLSGLTGTIAVLGDGAARYHERIANAAPVVFSPESLFVAEALGRLARPKIAAGQGLSAAELRPLYLRPPDIRVPRPRAVGV